jgi:phosphinothricin acetyltransferase
MPFPHLRIEAAQPEHYAAIAAIYNEYIAAGTATMEERLHTPADIGHWCDTLDERERLLVVTDAGQVIAWGIIRRYSPRAGYRFTCETSVYFTRSACGKGYGTWFKRHLMQLCQSLEYHHIVAKIFATNTTSIQYNLKLGYEIVGRQTQVGCKGGQWVDVVLMEYVFR